MVGLVPFMHEVIPSCKSTITVLMESQLPERDVFLVIILQVTTDLCRALWFPRTTSATRLICTRGTQAAIIAPIVQLGKMRLTDME